MTHTATSYLKTLVPHWKRLAEKTGSSPGCPSVLVVCSAGLRAAQFIRFTYHAFVILQFICKNNNNGLVIISYQDYLQQSGLVQKVCNKNFQCTPVIKISGIRTFYSQCSRSWYALVCDDTKHCASSYSDLDSWL